MNLVLLLVGLLNKYQNLQRNFGIKFEQQLISRGSSTPSLKELPLSEIVPKKKFIIYFYEQTSKNTVCQSELKTGFQFILKTFQMYLVL